MAKKQKKAPEGAPDWLVTYGDMVTLLLCFFVIIVSMSEIKKDDQFLKVLESIRTAFGYETMMGDTPVDAPKPNTLLQQLKLILVTDTQQDPGDSEQKSTEAREMRVTKVNDGILVEIGGRIAFDRFSAVLREDAERIIADISGKIKGKNTIIQITGHANNEPIPEGFPYRNAWDLSYARSRAVAETLVKYGVRRKRIRTIQAGAEAPLIPQAYTDEDRAANRRVDIVVTEALIEDYDGEPYSGTEKEL